MSAPPTGTVTFLFTDIEGSTNLARLHPNSWEARRQRHDAVLREAFETHQGHVFQISGDAFCIAYATAPDAVTAAISTQRALQAEVWRDAPIRVRLGLPTRRCRSARRRHGLHGSARAWTDRASAFASERSSM